MHIFITSPTIRVRFLPCLCVNGNMKLLRKISDLNPPSLQVMASVRAGHPNIDVRMSLGPTLPIPSPFTTAYGTHPADGINPILRNRMCRLMNAWKYHVLKSILNLSEAEDMPNEFS